MGQPFKMTVWLHDGVARYIEPMLRTGLYGYNETELVEYLLAHAIRGAIRDHLVPIIYAAAEFAEVQPAAPPRQPCPVCNDSDDLPKPCEKCGNLGIPF